MEEFVKTSQTVGTQYKDLLYAWSLTLSCVILESCPFVPFLLKEDERGQREI